MSLFLMTLLIDFVFSFLHLPPLLLSYGISVQDIHVLKNFKILYRGFLLISSCVSYVSWENIINPYTLNRDEISSAISFDLIH